MTDASADRTGARLGGDSGITAETNANGSLRRFDCGSISLVLFVGNELEGGPTNLYLRRLGGSDECTPLLGPQSPTCFEMAAQNGRFAGTGSWLGVDYTVELVLSKSATAWFWHVQLNNRTANAQVLDLTYAQDLALAPYGAVRMNEFYVSQYVDHTSLSHPRQGVVLASRQNQAADGRHRRGHRDEVGGRQRQVARSVQQEEGPAQAEVDDRGCEGELEDHSRQEDPRCGGHGVELRSLGSLSH